jgi:hypothetical protein
LGESFGLGYLGTEDSMPSNDFPSRWGRFLEVVSSGVLLLKMAFPSIMKTCLHIWTVPQENLLKHCDQSLLQFILSLFFFQVLLKFF